MVDRVMGSMSVSSHDGVADDGVKVLGLALARITQIDLVMESPVRGIEIETVPDSAMCWSSVAMVAGSLS